jgi:hypothetical protein
MYKQMMNMDEKKREEIEMKTTNPKARRSMNWRRRARAQRRRRRRSSRLTDRQTGTVRGLQCSLACSTQILVCGDGVKQLGRSESAAISCCTMPLLLPWICCHASATGTVACSSSTNAETTHFQKRRRRRRRRRACSFVSA